LTGTQFVDQFRGILFGFFHVIFVPGGRGLAKSLVRYVCRVSVVVIGHFASAVVTHSSPLQIWNRFIPLRESYSVNTTDATGRGTAGGPPAESVGGLKPVAGEPPAVHL
jgi:hypothetical protein